MRKAGTTIGYATKMSENAGLRRFSCFQFPGDPDGVPFFLRVLVVKQQNPKVTPVRRVGGYKFNRRQARRNLIWVWISLNSIPVRRRHIGGTPKEAA